MDPRREKEERQPKTTWTRTVEKELKEFDHTWGEIEKIAKNREDWKSLNFAL
jgi:hypothetical protein